MQNKYKSIRMSNSTECYDQVQFSHFETSPVSMTTEGVCTFTLHLDCLRDKIMMKQMCHATHLQQDET